MKDKIFLHQTLSKVITLAFAGLFSVYSLVSGVKEVKTEKPEDFQPVLRFAVCSDVHLSKEEHGQKNAEKFKDAINKAYELSDEDEEYKNLDAFIVAGDFTDSGKAEEYEVYRDVTKENIRGETQLLTCMGNHEHIEYRDTENPQKAIEVFREYVNESEDVHTVIGGYHFIGVSYDDNGDETFKTKLEWLKQQLDDAVADTGDKPIFVFQHPHPTLTVYGSVNWSNFDIRMVLKDYPQVVDFSGHSHYAANDPRSIHQSAFTALGCGAITGAMGNLSYISGDEYGDGDSGTFWLCEVDAEGNVRLRLYDIVSDCYYDGIDYYLTDLADKSRRSYTWGRMMAQDTGPIFPEDTTLQVSTDEEGNVKITFSEASGYYRAENYKLTLISADGKKTNLVVLSDYTRATDFEKTVDFGKLEAGDYTVKVRAYSPYAKRGQTIESTFTLEGNIATITDGNVK